MVPDWNHVELVVLMHEQRIARVFERHPTLTYKEYWFSSPKAAKYVGVNEPPDSGNHVSVTGVAAERTVAEFFDRLEAQTGWRAGSTGSSPRTTSSASGRGAPVKRTGSVWIAVVGALIVAGVFAANEWSWFVGGAVGAAGGYWWRITLGIAAIAIIIVIASAFLR
jgi:hypothetical protein